MNSKGPKPGAFLPAKAKAQISMMAIDGLDDIEIWPLGDVVGEVRGRPAVARADVSADGISGCGLSIVADPEPHPRHVNVTGWPASKEEQKLVALDLCDRAVLQRRPAN